MTWLAIVIVALVCVAFSAGFVVGGTVAALGIRARRPRPPVGGSYPRQAANALRLAPRPLSGPVEVAAPGPCEPPYDFEAEDLR